MKKPDEIKYPFSNYIIFAMVMDDPKLCKELIQRILPDKKVKEVRIKEHPKVRPEATILNGPEGKSIRMDILFEDGNIWADCEMQCTMEPDLPKRGRFYIGTLDIKMLKKGEDYQELKPSFIIFICRFDYYGRGEPIYSFPRHDPKLDLLFGDESYIILLNTKCPKEKVPEGLKSLFAYINEQEVTEEDPFIAEIHGRVLELQGNEEVDAIMTMEEHYNIMINRAAKDGLKQGREEGLRQGIEQGIEQGADQTLLEDVRNLMDTLALTTEQAMDALKVPEEKREKMRKLLA